MLRDGIQLFKLGVGIVLSTLIVYYVVSTMDYKEAISYCVTIYFVFSYLINIKPEIDSIWFKIASIILLLFSYLFLVRYSELRNYEMTTVLKLFSFPLYWTIVCYLAASYSKRKYAKNIVFIDLKLLKIATENRITLFDVIYSIIGWVSMVIWFVIVFSK